MPNEYPVKLYRIDGEQAVDIPPELELPDDEVVMYEEDGRVIIVPKSLYKPATESSGIPEGSSES